MSEVIKAGTLDKRITIEHYVITRDAAGQEVKTWSCWKTCYAQRVQPVTSNKEGIAENQLVSETVVMWRIRNVGKPNTKMRLIFDDTIYNIEGVDEIGSRVGWQLKTRRKE